ncbi:MAG: hypothetical protein WCA20_25760 [Candidatus Sulfotelmatobacter sp.]
MKPETVGLDARPRIIPMDMTLTAIFEEVPKSDGGYVAYAE